MKNTSTMWGLLALVGMMAIIYGVNARLLHQRDACRQRLEQLAPVLKAYAGAHGGKLPATSEELHVALGRTPLSTNADAPYVLASEPVRWDTRHPVPYLWDAVPHPFINGLHVLQTDGTVVMIDNLDAMGKQQLPQSTGH